MIEISFGKLVLLALVALIVLGPEKLPGVARTAGALLRRLRSGWDDVRAEVERELQVEEIRRAAREAVAHADAAQAELDDSLRQMREMADEPVADAAAVPPREDGGTVEPAGVEAEPAPVADPSVADSRTGDLFAAAPAESATGHKEPTHGRA